MVIFHSYVKLPEGKMEDRSHENGDISRKWTWSQTLAFVGLRGVLSKTNSNCSLGQSKPAQETDCDAWKVPSEMCPLGE
jgi:hypothetical protein